MEQYTILGRVGEGAHGIVLKAKHIEVILLSMIYMIIRDCIFNARCFKSLVPGSGYS
jgi:hypothetical protein